eukprot:4986752-Alexandrium_andersonii.AAC.1
MPGSLHAEGGQGPIAARSEQRWLPRQRKAWQGTAGCPRRRTAVPCRRAASEAPTPSRGRPTGRQT